MARTLGSTNKPKLITWAGGTKDPALFLAKVMADEEQDGNRRVQAAVALLPYVHRKLPIAVESDINATGSFSIEIRRVGNGTEAATG